MPTQIKPTREHAVKILDVLSHGLSHGLGERLPGKMCVEAAVCFAFDLPHGDEPPCVGAAVRSFKIALNDCGWSSPMARANGMRRIAIAQLGSNEIDQNLFVKELALATVRKIVPLTLRAAANMPGNSTHKASLEKHAVKCEAVNDLNAARAASDAASYAARAASDAASDAASYAARAASDAASDAARAASYAASYAASDEVLSLMAECGVEALQKCGSPGCQWLDLTDKCVAA